MQKQIRVVCDDQILFGVIDILNKDGKNIYAVWRLFDQEKRLLASLTNNYFLSDKNASDDEIFHMIKRQILNYRVGRRKKFTSAEFI